MTRKGFRKLDMDLPRQPVVNQRIFSVGGWLLLLVFVGLVVYAYLRYR